MMSVGAVIALASLAFSALVASQARDIRFSESGMVRARGATASQEIALMTGETLLIAVLSLVAGAAIALLGVSLAGRLPVLSELTGGEFLPASLSVQSALAAIVSSRNRPLCLADAILEAKRVDSRRAYESIGPPADSQCGATLLSRRRPVVHWCRRAVATVARRPLHL